jgi:AbrB family looped-hinge helix DNA binding protein
MKLSIVEVDKNYRIVISKEIRKVFSIKPGQKVYILAAGDKIILIPLPENIDKELDKLSSDIEWNRKVRENLEQFLVSKAEKKRNE